MSKSQNTKFYSENEIQPQDKNTQTENLSHLRVTKQRKVIENQGDQTNQQVQYDQHSPQQKQKLLDVMLKIQLHKNKKRAKKLVNNLPSRMLKSFDEKKFHFLNDKSYIYDQVFFQQSLQNNQLSSAQEDKLLNSDNQNEVETISQPTIKQNLKNIQQKRQSELILNFNKDEIVEQGRFQLLYSSTQKQFNKLLYLLKKSSKVLYQTIQRLINYIPIIQPSNIFKLFWDIFNMLNIIICIFLLPIKIIFDFNFTQILSIQLLHIIPICLILDVIININTGYFKKGQVIKQRYKIFMHFIKKRFFSDIISIFPLILDMFEDIVCIYKSSDSAFQQDHFSHQSFFKIIQLMFFLKIFTFSYNLRKMEERFNLSNTLINILQLTKLFFTLILINHFFACIWIFVARVQIQNGNSQTWMSYDNIYLSSWKSQYIASFYFMTVTMITVGYGDILPKNDIEMTLSISTMIFASGVFGYCLNQVGVIFNNFFYIDNQIKKKLLEIQKYMSKKNINSNLQLQIREYLEYYWREQSEICQEQEQETIQKLSESLRSKLLFEANKIVLQDSPIFKQNFSKPVIEQTVPLIHQIKYTPENDILVRGIQDDQSIYFIENGSVEVILDAKQKNSQRIYTLKKGQSFGEYTFFTGLPRIENIRSREFTTVLKISRQDFLNLISRYPEDVENFSNIRDQIAYLDDYTKINLKCLSCHSFNHHINDCLYLHYIPKKARIIKTYNDLINSQNLQRQKYERRQNNKDYYFKNSKIINLEVVKQVQMYLELNESILDAQDEMNYSQGYFDIDKLENIDDKNLNNFNEEVCKVQKYIDNDGNSQNYLITKNGVSKFGSPTIKGNVEDLNSQITSSIQINENLSDNQANNEFTRLNSFKANIMNYFDNKAEFQKQYSLKNNQENSLNSSQKLERINSLQNNQYNGYDNFQYNSSELSNQQIRRISQIDDSQELFKNNQKQTPSSFLSLFKLKKNNTINSFNEPNDCPEKNQQLQNFNKSYIISPSFFFY